MSFQLTSVSNTREYIQRTLQYPSDGMKILSRDLDSQGRAIYVETRYEAIESVDLCPYDRDRVTVGVFVTRFSSVNKDCIKSVQKGMSGNFKFPREASEAERSRFLKKEVLKMERVVWAQELCLPSSLPDWESVSRFMKKAP